MELLAGFVLDLAGIALEALDVALEKLVLVLELLHLGVQRAGLVPLLLVDGDAVGPEDNVVGDGKCKQCGAARGELAFVEAPGFELGVEVRQTRGDASPARTRCHEDSRGPHIARRQCGCGRAGAREPSSIMALSAATAFATIHSRSGNRARAQRRLGMLGGTTLLPGLQFAFRVECVAGCGLGGRTERNLYANHTAHLSRWRSDRGPSTDGGRAPGADIWGDAAGRAVRAAFCAAVVYAGAAEPGEFRGGAGGVGAWSCGWLRGDGAVFG